MVEVADSTHGHSSMYVMHKFFGRKQERIFKKYIKEYAQNAGDIVLDPFCGSGITIGEAVSLGRKAIGIDINPVSIFITRNTLSYSSNEKMLKEFKAIEGEIKSHISYLYNTKCSKCGNIIPATCFTWKHSDLSDRRYICLQDGKCVESIKF